jgi:Holliday junction resolvasome RuvABC ATP-dependent DNA helicase subunit
MTQAVSPVSSGAGNPLRPTCLADVIGQERTKRLLGRAIDSVYERRRPLEHTLLLGPSGTGKTTLAMTLGAEMKVDVYHLSAPISFDTLASLRTLMYAGDLLFIDEIHLQAIQERRGKTAGTQPEVLFSIMEDRTLVTPSGVLPYPEITLIGATTDPGLLPEPFLNRFALRPVLEPYTDPDLARIVRANANVLEVALTEPAVMVLVRASRRVPRECNNLVRSASILHKPGATVGEREALDVLQMLGLTTDGLTPQMQAMLRYLLASPRNTRDGVLYSASVGSIATGIGLARDRKAVELHVEPWLIQQGWVQVQAGVGRILTDRGVERARRLA